MAGNHPGEAGQSSAFASLGRAVGRTRYVVLVAVAAVLLVSVTLFLLGAAQGVSIVVQAWADAFQHGRFSSTDLTVEFLAVIGVMLRAVVMYLIGVGLYSLFIKPLNLTAALGVESLVDLGLSLAVEPQRGQIVHLRMEGVETGNWPVVLPPGSHYLLAFEGAAWSPAQRASAGRGSTAG